MVCSDEATSAHPRVCGENLFERGGVSHGPGSSPRVRGKRLRGLLREDSDRLIPACAGKTISEMVAMKGTPAHPRVCGENSVGASRSERAAGSSPRVRGKPSFS